MHLFVLKIVPGLLHLVPATARPPKCQEADETWISSHVTMQEESQDNAEIRKSRSSVVSGIFFLARGAALTRESPPK